MSRVNIIILLITIIVITSIWLIIYSTSSKNVDFVRALDASPIMFEREVTEISIESDLLADTTTIFRPAQIRFVNNYIYLNDFADFTIYEYDLNGSQNRKLTTTRGRGPGEVQHLTDFDVFNDTIWIVDSQNMRVTSYSIESGKNINNFSLEKRPMRITCLTDGFVIQWLGSDHLFSKFDYEGNEVKQFGDIIEDQLLHQISLDGTIRSNGNDRFVYIPFYASLIYHFEGNGELINILRAPDGLEFPVAQRDGPTTFAPDFTYMRDGYIDEEDNLYVYTRLPNDISQINQDNNLPVSYIDKYSLREAEYLYSLRLNNHYISLMYNPSSSTAYASDMEKSFVYELNQSF